MASCDYEDLERYFLENEPWLLECIQKLVAMESPSGDIERLNKVAGLLEEILAELGAEVETASPGERPVLARFGSANALVGLVFHHDTVWPVGAFPQARQEGNLWYGPGIYDMKANIALVLLSLKYLAKYHPELLEGILFVSSPDEETLGPVSEKILPEFLKECARALVFEPPLADGGLKQSRKGSVRLKVTFSGKPSHTGNHYEKGRSALAAAARFLIFAENLSDLGAGHTVNIGLLSGGSAVNTRPGFAEMDIDIRMVELTDWQKTKVALGAYRDARGVLINVEQVGFLPPMNSLHSDWNLLKRICEKIEIPFSLGSAGGGSDGSRLAAMGIRVMDGLGVCGGGEHAEHEHISSRSLKSYFIRNTLLLMALQEAPT